MLDGKKIIVKAGAVEIGLPPGLTPPSHPLHHPINRFPRQVHPVQPLASSSSTSSASNWVHAELAEGHHVGRKPVVS